MDSQYSIFLNSKRVPKDKEVELINTFYLRNITDVFGTSKMEIYHNVIDYGYRKLSQFEKIRKLWVEMRNESEGGAQLISDIVQGFAYSMKKVLDSKYLNLKIEYDIQMKGKQIPYHESILKFLPTEYSIYPWHNGRYANVLQIKINVQNVTSIKTLFESMIHDIAHGVESMNVQFMSDTKLSYRGEFDIEHDLQWVNTARFLLDTFCRQPLTRKVMQHTMDLPGDIRSELDVTMKVI